MLLQVEQSSELGRNIRASRCPGASCCFSRRRQAKMLFTEGSMSRRQLDLAGHGLPSPSLTDVGSQIKANQTATTPPPVLCPRASPRRDALILSLIGVYDREEHRGRRAGLRCLC